MEESVRFKPAGGGSFNPLSMYPIGSIYRSVKSTDPSELFGGTWELLKDVFLMAAGDKYAAGSTGGEAEHNHPLSSRGQATIGNYYDTIAFRSSNAKWADDNVDHQMWAFSHNGDFLITKDTAHYNEGCYVALKGSTDNASNIPPYLAVYTWVRVA